MRENRPKLLTNKCNYCGETLIPDVYDFYICSGCGGQVVPPSDSKREVKKQIAEAMANVSSPIIKVHSTICSGSKSKSSSGKKQKMQRPSTTQIYNTLSGSNNKIIYKKAD